MDLAMKPLPWTWEYVEHGGYDSMTCAVFINAADRSLVAALDLGDYGQSKTWGPQEETDKARAEAERIAELMCRAANGGTL